MKYAIIIPDGAADDPLDILDGKTAIEGLSSVLSTLDVIALSRRMPVGVMSNIVLDGQVPVNLPKTVGAVMLEPAVILAKSDVGAVTPMVAVAVV